MHSEPIIQVVPIIDTEGPTTGRDDMFDNWQALDRAMTALVTETRSRFKDSFGGIAKYSWFLLDWAGYSPDDAEFKRRGHDGRLHGIWKFYREKFLTDSRLEESGDGLYWHYHHPPKDGSWGWNDKWGESRWYEYILGKRMLDFQFFPAAYRAGKYVENDENSRWLEQWIPIDFSSISPVKQEFCDWSRAPVDWQPYHPSDNDYQRPGAMRRLVARSLPVAAKGGSGVLKEEEVEKAFSEAADKGMALFSFHTHDYYKDIHDNIAAACAMVDKASARSGISWKFSNALEAARYYMEPVSGDFYLRMERGGKDVHISASHAIFGEMPFVVLEYGDEKVIRTDVEQEGNGWMLRIPDGVRRIAAGAADQYGNTHVATINI